MSWRVSTLTSAAPEGSITSYTTANGRRYRVRYRDPDRRSKEKYGFVRRKDAEDYLASITVASNRGDYVDPQSARFTISELGARWIDNQTHLKPSAFRAIESSWRVHVQPVWGARRIGDILHSDVQTWITKLAAGDGKQKSATVVLRAYGVLAGILDVAVRDRRIASNAARGVKLPRRTKKKRVYLTPTQVELLARNAGRHGTLVHVLAYTGVRWGEAVGLRVASIDTVRCRI